MNKRLSLILAVFLVLIVSGAVFVMAQRGQTSGAAAKGSQIVLQSEPKTPAEEKPLDPEAEVAKLGDTVVKAGEFEKRFLIAVRSMASQQGAKLDEATLKQFAALRPQFLDQYATQLALLGEAAKRKIEVADSDVEAELKKLKDSAGDAFDSTLKSAGYKDEAELKSYIKESLNLQKVVAELQKETKISDTFLKNFYDDNTDKFKKSADFCAKHILVDTKAEADKLYDELKGGADFAELAKKNSKDPGSAKNGGELGCMQKGQTVPPFEKAGFSAKLNEVTKPVKSQFGYHILDVYERHDEGIAPYNEVKEQIKQQLASEQLQKKVEAIRKNSGVETFPDNLPTVAPAAPEGADSAPAEQSPN